MIETGWVYIFSNPSIPGQIKIGVTSKLPRERAKELRGSGIPTPYKVEGAYLFSESAEKVEKKVHLLLNKERVSKDREWFSCSPQEAAIKVLEAAELLGVTIKENRPRILSEDELASRKEEKIKRKREQRRKEQDEKIKAQIERRALAPRKHRAHRALSQP